MNSTPHYEIVFAAHAWRAVMPRLLTDPSAVAVGALGRNQHPAGCELLVDGLAVAPAQPRGEAYSPLADWLAVACPDAGHWNVSERLDQLAPRAGQLVAMLHLGGGADRGEWSGVVYEQGRLWPLTGLRVVGPGMPQARPMEFGASDPASDDAGRWRRTRGALGETVWHKVRSSSVLVFGAGRSGSALAWQLAALGVRQLRLVDPDRLEPANLDGMFGVGEADVGRSKVVGLAEQLVRFRPDLAVSALPVWATDAGALEAARDADLLVTAADNGTPDLVAAILARRLLKPHLSIGSGVTRQSDARLLAADARLLLPGQGCALCVGGLGYEEQARYEILAPPGALRRGEPADAGRIGSLVTLNSMNVSIGVQLWLDLLAGKLATSWWHRLEWVAGQGVRADAGPVGAADDCRLCHAHIL
jgi:hypothetical protein